MPRGLADPARLPRRLRRPRRRSACCSPTRSAPRSATSQHDVPRSSSEANRDLANLQNWLDRNGINVQIQQQGQTALQTLQKTILKSSGSIVSFSRDLLTKVVTISFDLVLVLVLSVYLLVYGQQIGELVRRIMPPGDGTPEDDYPLLVQRPCPATCAGSCCSA